MNISDLIVELENMKTLHGNLPVYTMMEYFDTPCEEVILEEEYIAEKYPEIYSKPKRVVIY